ncbi:hypothetical protein ACOSQ2_006725 [Xanthoceras sorbifolium]
MNRAKRYKEVVVLFTYFFEQFEIVPNVISYNNLINTHCDEGRVDMAMRVYSHVMYRHLTKGFIDSGRIDKAMDLLREMLNKRQGADSIRTLFNELKKRCMVYDEVVNATFMEWWFSQGNENDTKMISATYNALLEVLLKYGKKSEAWALFERMLDNHQTPTCFKLRKFSKAIDTFDRIEMHLKSKAFIMDVAGYNNIITQFCENEMLDEAEKLLGEMPTKSLPPDTTDSGLDFSKDVIDQMIRASVGITPALHNFVSEAFGQVGREVVAAAVIAAAAATESMEAKVSEDTYAAY